MTEILSSYIPLICQLTDSLPDLEDELLQQCRLFTAVKLEIRLECYVGDDGLSGELVGHANDGSLGNAVVLNQCRLNLSGRETVTRDVDDVVDTSSDPVVAIVITSSTVAGEVVAGIRL